jgi:multidrug efflux system membrane fusion protein
VRLLVDTRKNAVTMPAVAVQRGPQGLYTWVVKDDNTVDQRPVDATVINDVAMVRNGVNAGDRVVVNGQYRLQSGSRVDAKPVDATKTADKTPS